MTRRKGRGQRGLSSPPPRKSRERGNGVQGSTDTCLLLLCLSQGRQVRGRTQAGPHPEGDFSTSWLFKQRLPALRQFRKERRRPTLRLPRLPGLTCDCAGRPWRRRPSLVRARPRPRAPSPRSPSRAPRIFQRPKVALFISEAASEKHTKAPTVHDNGSAQARPM